MVSKSVGANTSGAACERLSHCAGNAIVPEYVHVSLSFRFSHEIPFGERPVLLSWNHCTGMKWLSDFNSVRYDMGMKLSVVAICTDSCSALFLLGGNGLFIQNIKCRCTESDMVGVEPILMRKMLLPRGLP